MTTAEEEFLLVLEEIRWENLIRTTHCNCSPDGDGPPCPHGNYITSLHELPTEADVVKVMLEDWEYEGDLPEETDISEDETGDEIEEVEEEATVNLMAPNVIPNDISTEGEEENWYFDDATGEWKSS